MNAAVLAARVLPARVKRPLRTVVRAPGLRLPTLQALARWDAGDHTGCLDMLDAATREAARRGDRRTLRRLAALAVAIQQPVQARTALAALPETDVAKARLHALMLWHEGHLRAALTEVDKALLHATRGRRTAATRRTRRRLAEELSVLDPGWSTGPRPQPPHHAAAPRRVLHVVTNSLPHKSAGYTVRSHHLVRAQQTLGIDPHVVTRLGFPVTQGRYANGAMESHAGVCYHRLIPPGPLPRGLSARMALNVDMASELVTTLRPALLHAASNHLNAQIALSLRERHGLPVVYEVRGFLEETWLSRQGDDARNTDRYRLTREVETHCMHEADLVVTLGQVMKDEIVGRGVPEQKVRIVPNAVDPAYLLPPPDPRPLRHRLGIPDDAVVIGTISSLVPYEGLDHLLRAARRLVDAGLPVRLLLVGEGAARHHLAALARELGLGELTTLPGHVPHADARQYHAAIDVFAVPRTGDRVCHMVTPLKPFEAMASGRPVVASQVRALEEVVTHDVTGLLVPPGDEEALADALALLVTAADLRTSLGAAGRDWIAGQRTWEHNGQKYLAIYETLGLH